MPAAFRVQLVEGENLRGTLLFYDPRIKASEFSFLFDFLKERVKALGYTVHTSNTLKVRHERYLEQIWKVVLTPPASDVPGSSLCNQLYGNVLLDYVEVNKKPGYIRLAANSYQDAFFSRPLPFEELLEHVLR
ncbi:hypothetical protein [Pontibacter mangrovi]|uniref:Uncharacterized protein n=1 Tax=Pontibacter mangrovi TaxID=2589816 RepID=A0A501WK60_9BACT|nr:hypothetical protein [Pontibacter mangrovi]TPE46026.1 hypothetical protein FJM65_01390 [Pontibacter mangrovi]